MTSRLKKVAVPPRPVYTDPVPRFRLKRAIVATPSRGETVWLNCSGPSSWTAYPIIDIPVAALNGRDENMFDWVIPRFHKRVREGEVFFNNMAREVVTIETKGAGTWSQRQTVGTDCSGTIRNNEFRHTNPNTVMFIPTINTPYYPVWPVENSALSDRSVEDLKTLVSTEVLSKRGRSDSDIWEMIAEMDKTLHLLRGPVLQLNDLSSRLHKSIATNTKSRALVKEISADYLLYRYGISPLIKDILSIMKTFERTWGKQRKSFRAKDSDSSKSFTSGSFAYGAALSSWSLETTETIQIRGVSLEEVDLSILSNMGFSSKGLITLPWELTGYSFVADWFYNFGDLLGAMVPAYGYKNLGSCLSIERTRVNLYSVTTSQYSGAGNWHYTGSFGGTCAIVRQTSTRQGLSAPGLVMKSDFKFDKMTRMADAVALIASRFVKIHNLIGPQPVRYPTYRQRKNMSLWLNQPGVS